MLLIYTRSHKNIFNCFFSTRRIYCLRRKKKKDLWFQFDNYFHFEIQRGDPKVDAMNEVMGYSNTKPFGILTSKDLTDYLNTETARPLINSVRNNLLPGYVEIFNNFLVKILTKRQL